MLFRQYGGLAIRVGVGKVIVTGNGIPIREVFDGLGEGGAGVDAAMLKSRRAAVVRAVDEALKSGRVGKDVHAAIVDEKYQLLHDESRLDDIHEQQLRETTLHPPNTSNPRPITAKVKFNLLDCARSCDNNIAGCYAPNGVHCEKPLEIGLRDDMCILALHDETDTEIETIETGLTTSGLYIYKSYSNSHSYDTSQCWLDLFHQLLSTSTNCSPLVPAIIIPEGHPTPSTFARIASKVSPELCGFTLDFRHDAFDGFRSHFDSAIKMVKAGRDVVLTPELVGKLRNDRRDEVSDVQNLSPFGLSGRQYTLAAEIFRDFLVTLQGDKARWKALGGVISRFIEVVIDSGSREGSAVKELADAIDWARWKKSSKTSVSKEELVNTIVAAVVEHVLSWCWDVDVEVLFVQKRHQFWQLWSFLKNVDVQMVEGSEDVKEMKLHRMKRIVAMAQYSVRIDSLDPRLQVEFMRWIFKNEDKVWRFRGGRHGETLEEFLAFLDLRDTRKSTSTPEVGRVLQVKYPGVCIVLLPKGQPVGCRLHKIRHLLQADDILGYVIGEFVEDPTAHHRPPATTPTITQDATAVRSQLLHSPHPLTITRHVNPKTPSSPLSTSSPSTPHPTAHHQPPQPTYEIVTAWIHPRHRHNNLALQLYTRTIRDVFLLRGFSPWGITFDVLTGTLERVAQVNRICRMGLRWALEKREESYEVEVAGAEEVEVFEKVFLRGWRVGVLAGAWNMVEWVLALVR
ncbi:hypothetical protein HDV00_005245 [Rhizophlyctis rosea]|nr:hypothetical protein HDV00_005245 [Rhizophlyctis rosea]